MAVIAAQQRATTTQTARPGFRSDINGLRAWAVVAVILYHFGVPGLVGGFIGVDVFFVISGFLMTGIVLRGLERGDFSLAAFYLARARRIVPGLAALCAVLLALGWCVLLPPDYRTLGSHVLYSLSFVSNIEYWKEAGYFDVASQEKWLLHTWSLAVEWQFYLLFPIAVCGVWRLAPGRMVQRRALATALVLSFAASVWLTQSSPTMAFYLLPTRAWEMLAGGLVFMAPAPGAWSAATRRRVERTGLSLMVLSVFLFDQEAAWPGWRAAVPVLAAGLILAARRTSAWTGNPLAQWLGKRAYSLYLWHWPVVVTLAYIERTHDAAALAAGLVVTAILGHCSYQWIECGTRARLERLRLRHAAIGLAAMAGAVALPGVAVWAAHGVAKRFPPAIERVADEENNVNPRGALCHPNTGATSPSCVYGGAARRVLVVGDSHANALVSSIAAAAPDASAGVVQWTYSGCAFVPGMHITPAALAQQGPGYQCSAFIGWVQAQLDAAPPTLPVLVIGRYAVAAFGRNDAHNPAPIVYFSRLYPAATPAFLAEFSEKITDSACQLARRRTVYLMRPIPEMGIDVPKSLSRRMALGVQGDISIPLADYRRRNAWVWAAQDAARDRCGVKILDPLPYLCRAGRCDGSRDGQPLYHDDNHLSESGNKLLAPMFAGVFGARKQP